MTTDASRRLAGRRIALLIEEGFSAREVLESVRILEAEGAAVVVVGPSTKAPYRDKTGTADVTAALTAGTVRRKDFDALVVHR